MSHFTVMVRVPADVRFLDLEDIVDEMLLPYKESGCGSDDPPELKKYLEFEDAEEEGLKEYTTELVDAVRWNGKYYTKYDREFRNPHYNVFSGDRSNEYVYPTGSEQVKVPFSSFYPTFDDYMTGWHGYEKRDAKTGKYGYWQNPNRKWDWYQIGGRWNGQLLTVNGEANISKISQLAWWQIESQTLAKMEEFWNNWTDLCNGKKFGVFEGPREKALDIGLLRCMEVSELTGDEWKWNLWESQTTRCDVYKYITKEEFMASYKDHFIPISTYARLDNNGWQEPGEMGWWGMSGASVETRNDYQKGFYSWLKSGNQEDWIIVVDCHI